jgi:hypothetical protein
VEQGFVKDLSLLVVSAVKKTKLIMNRDLIMVWWAVAANFMAASCLFDVSATRSCEGER